MQSAAKWPRLADLAQQIDRTPRRRLVGLSFWLVALLSLIGLAAMPKSEVVRIEVEATSPGALQLFFDQGAGFSENLSATRTFEPGTQTLEFPLPAGESRQIRLDPSPGTDEIVLHRIESTAGDTAVPLANLSQAHEVASVLVTDTAARVRMQSDALDPQLLVRLDQPLATDSRIATAREVLWQVLLAFGVVLVVWHLNLPQVSSLLFASMAITLVLVMALLSPLVPSPHPDEFLHVADAGYFATHWLPPALASGELAPSYTNNVYGVSYLYEWNIAYWFAGKAGSLASAIGIGPLLAYRLFNASLMGLVALTIVWARLPMTTLAVLFVTPQLWYVFAYFNGDAFPLAMACIAVAFAISRGGPVQTYIASGGRIPVQAVLFAVAMAMLLISKKNFLPAAVFASLWLCASCLRLRTTMAAAAVGAFGVCVCIAAAGAALQAEFGLRWQIPALVLFATGAILGARWLYEEWLVDPARRPALIRFASLHLIVIVIALPWIGTDVLRNGTGAAKAELVTGLREQHAAHPFKPSTILQQPEQSQPGLQLAAKDVGFVETLRAPYSWVRGSFQSFFSAYGYMKFYGSPWLYALFGGALGVMALTGAVSGLRGGAFGIRHLALVFGCSAVVVVAAALHSWTYDFQPQGRYIFGVLPMLMPLFAAEPAQRGVLRGVFHAALLTMIALSAYSFIQIGLDNLV